MYTNTTQYLRALASDLVHGCRRTAADGTVIYTPAEGYFVCEKNSEAFEQFEATFPKKEKLKLPGQLF